MYTNILSEFNPIFKSKCLNFKQNPDQSVSATLQAERHLDFNPTLFYAFDLLSCAGKNSGTKKFAWYELSLLQAFQNVKLSQKDVVWKCMGLKGMGELRGEEGYFSSTRLLG